MKSNTPPSDNGPDGGDEPGQREQSDTQGTLILNATCVPQNIRFPADVSLFNEGRKLLEGMIDTAHEAGATERKKPRTYRDLDRRRDLGYLAGILARHPEALRAKEQGAFGGDSADVRAAKGHVREYDPPGG